MHTDPLLEDLTCRLLRYFASVGDPSRHHFTVSDINLQVMMNAYAAKERDLLAIALAQLVNEGSLLRASLTSYDLTDQGMHRVRSVRDGLDYVA